MSFSILSGDFLSEYNNLIQEYRAKQRDLDNEFDGRISSITSREATRLEEMYPAAVPVGARVKTYDGKIGVVESSTLEFATKRGGKNEWDNDVCGPERYWPIEDTTDEMIVTCEGYMRVYDVKFEPHVLAQDWGIEEDLLKMTEDEFEVLAYAVR